MLRIKAGTERDRRKWQSPFPSQSQVDPSGQLSLQGLPLAINRLSWGQGNVRRETRTLGFGKGGLVLSSAFARCKGEATSQRALAGAHGTETVGRRGWDTAQVRLLGGWRQEAPLGEAGCAAGA